jgi:transcriptional regulator with PAS, ATPase and Fis domain
MTEICEIALKIAPLDIPVLIMGDSGVGKGLLAQIIHKASFRSDRTMIEINCASIPESLIDSELFGYGEGTFTGGRKMGKTGLIEAAHKSTILLDEIAAMPLEFQTRLLKFLDDGYILPLGSRERKWIDVRVIAATNFDLSEQVAKGRFRKDLFYRLSVLPINIPPLCNRKEDINIFINDLIAARDRAFNNKNKEINQCQFCLNWLNKDDLVCLSCGKPTKVAILYSDEKI